VLGFALLDDPESYAGGSVAAGRDRQVKRVDSDKM